jgi:vancomycin resistance protein YoaR
LTNIHRAADLMDDTLLLPGKVFSLNKEVGERTGARGFAQGYVISGGRLEVDYGGGVSQLATTVFNAAFFAGLEDVEHHPHSFYISRYPEGREATVAWGAKDLRFRNDTETGIFITTGYTNSSVSVRIWGTKIYDVGTSRSGRYNIKPFRTVHNPKPSGTSPGDCVNQPGVVGFTVDVTRTLSRGGQRVRSENLHTVYQPEERIICGSSGPRTPKPTRTPPPPPSTPPPAD